VFLGLFLRVVKLQIALSFIKNLLNNEEVNRHFNSHFVSLNDLKIV